MNISLKRLALEFYRLYRHNEIKMHPLTYFFGNAPCAAISIVCIVEVTA